ncbi:hypothetical protein SRHO_G00146350 [Serrasalmus rhombeus]
MLGLQASGAEYEHVWDLALGRPPVEVAELKDRATKSGEERVDESSREQEIHVCEAEIRELLLDTKDLTSLR